MATTRAKFRVHNIVPSNQGGRVEMSPVYSADPQHENKAFWDATPNGSISMWVNNPEGFATFEMNREYYVDFTPAPVDAALPAEPKG